MPGSRDSQQGCDASYDPTQY